MAPLEAYQAHKPAEDLQPSQGNAFARSKQKKIVFVDTGVLQRKAASQNQEVQSSVASVGEASGARGLEET